MRAAGHSSSIEWPDVRIPSHVEFKSISFSLFNHVCPIEMQSFFARPRIAAVHIFSETNVMNSHQDNSQLQCDWNTLCTTFAIISSLRFHGLYNTSMWTCCMSTAYVLNQQIEELCCTCVPNKHGGETIWHFGAMSLFAYRDANATWSSFQFPVLYNEGKKTRS